jgi:hypothetical protein
MEKPVVVGNGLNSSDSHRGLARAGPVGEANNILLSNN